MGWGHSQPTGRLCPTNVGSYYAAYFSGLKFECVHMSELEKQYDRAQLLQRKLWPHPTG